MPRDGALTLLSVAEATRLRALVHAAFAEHSLDVTVGPGSATAGTGWRFNLANLAAVCHNDSRAPGSWPALVNEHVARVVRSVVDQQTPQALSREELLARIHPRLVTSDPASLKAFGYGPRSVPGLLDVLALDLPETVDLLAEDSLAELGDQAVLWERAFQNLRAVHVDRHEVLTGDNGTRFDVLTGDSYFIASLALILDEVVGRYTEELPSPHGILVALPHRHALAFHVVRDLGVLPSLHGMARFAAAGFAESPGALTHSVFWWFEGGFVEVATHGGADLPVALTQEAGDLMARLGAE
ncbi:hypothetical protein GCM10010193_33030 [Kitasatospora atroaurantiaca]|uniref:Uncharacterized protein n=1 Tax=Kitasatospora atroaurantiaca TaxID=285545 RepID=A0A561ERP1_9ACTN|nr:hypothetical protein [Kitasatospora atroaurantiaca]TWE18280.1 hypothetical protein FB465_3340 [Kitasatospora atroaurantiaca]